MMEGKRRMVHDDEVGEIKKGPWKAEEDEVLINHVKKYGPRDWSSIRSKGLLRRTGKSCRLRWVNKLRPDLKTGMKFSAEEERTVIDLQAQFGNKWARIATYLPGRTDNDVKNFWSSRQKRLARILQASSSTTSSSKPQKNAKEIQAPALHDVLSMEAPKFSSSTEEESYSHTDDSRTIKLVPFNNQMYQSSLIQENSPLQLDYNNYIPPEKKLLSREIQQTHLSFPHIPQLQQDFPLPLESQDYIDTNLGEPSFLDEFEHSGVSALGTAQVPIVPTFSGPDTTNCQRIESHDAVDLDSFINDFPPIDIFDNIDSLPSPSQWP